MPRQGNLVKAPDFHGSRKWRGLRKYCFFGAAMMSSSGDSSSTWRSEATCLHFGGWVGVGVVLSVHEGEWEYIVVSLIAVKSRGLTTNVVSLVVVSVESNCGRPAQRLKAIHFEGGWEASGERNGWSATSFAGGAASESIEMLSSSDTSPVS
jgi:hypothetical protein